MLCCTLYASFSCLNMLIWSHTASVVWQTYLLPLLGRMQKARFHNTLDIPNAKEIFLELLLIVWSGCHLFGICLDCFFISCSTQLKTICHGTDMPIWPPNCFLASNPILLFLQGLDWNGIMYLLEQLEMADSQTLLLSQMCAKCLSPVWMEMSCDQLHLGIIWA